MPDIVQKVNKIIDKFTFGLITTLENDSIPFGASQQGSKNWIDKGDRIELRRGSRFFGDASLNTGLGKTSAIKKVVLATSDAERLFGSYGQKLKYFDEVTDEWVEIGSNLLGSNVVDSSGLSKESISLEEYVGLAGNQLFVNSKNCSGFYKIMVANPTDYTNMYVEGKNFKGLIKVDLNRTLLWKTLKDQTGVYGSYVDLQGYWIYSDLANSDFPAEVVGTGDGATTTFTNTLSFKLGVFTVTIASPGVFTLNNHGLQLNDMVVFSTTGALPTGIIAGKAYYVISAGLTANAFQISTTIGGTAVNTSGSQSGVHTLVSSTQRTCFGISVTDGVETFIDDYNGNLVGSLGGTGTINYMTGAISVTFHTAPINLSSVKASYQAESSNYGGITDFTKSTPRTAGQGFVFRQDESAGSMQTIKSYNNVYYCLHVKRTYALTIGSDDTTATNLPYRHRVGIPNDRAAVETGEGIYYIDETMSNDTRVRLLTYDNGGSQQVIPVPISNNINLNNYTFDEGASTLYGDYVLFAGREKSSTVNNVTFLYNKLYKTWNMLDYCVTCFDIYNGALVAGDSISNNFMELFSGLDELGSPIDNNYTTGYMKLADGLVKSKKMKLRGSIGPDQSIKVSASIDGGPYVEVRTADDIANSTVDRDLHFIEGDGTYVDRSNRVTVGPSVLGRKTVGGGGDGIEAYTYEREISLPLDKFELISLKFEATRIGWAEVMLFGFQDVRFKGKKIPRKYRG